ncbi:MAG: Uma2 family endonuclease [Gammaproteobacteria bacterium]|nr:Uma2 family endonuclease [Gammaproteobacteria bacterium]
MKQPAVPVAVEYPSSDGKPMAESHRHAMATVNAWQGLTHYYSKRSDVYVGMDMLMYFVEGDPRQSVVPDVFVVLGAPKMPLRDNWLVWEEGRVPDFVLEITSRTTRREDEGRKRQLYERLGVAEYLQYDPTGDYLDPVLKGAQLVDGSYRPITATFTPDGAPRLASALGLELHVVDEGLRLFDPSRRRHLPVFEEEIGRANAAQQRANVAEQRANVAEQRADAAEQRANAAEHGMVALGREVDAHRRGAGALRRLADVANQLADAAKQATDAAKREAAAAGRETEAMRLRAEAAERRIAELEAQFRAGR